MRRFLPVLLLCSAVACGSVPTQTWINPMFQPQVHQKVVVLPFDSKFADGRNMADAFVTQFMGCGFVAVERGLADSVIQEINLEGGVGALNVAQLKKMREVLNADGIVLGSIDALKTGEVNSVSLRLIDIRTGDVLLSSSFKNEKMIEVNQIPSAMMEDISKQLRQLAKKRAKEERARKKAEARKAAAAAKALARSLKNK